MKTKLLFSFLLSFFFYLLSSQIPQGFNYQAVARNLAGDVLANQSLPARIAIQTSGGSVLWEELHNVTSDKYGLISLVVGTGAGTGAGSLTSFSAIDWNSQPLYIKTTIQYPGTTWTVMGTSQIWSVPYSLVAKDLSGPVGKLGITGETDQNTEALFEVKNKGGQTVFAVYNEGVRIYVSDGSKGVKGGFAVGGFGTEKAGESTRYLFVDKDSVRIYLDTNPATKGSKGGFAVGGYDLLKGVRQDYLNISGDSIRMYINDQGKAAKGGFAVGGFDQTKGGNKNFLNVATDAGGIIKSPENRILWYPIKNAFLTGRILIESPDSVGENSFASGYESKAVGDWSQSLGFKTASRGDYSTAIGKNSSTKGANSFAFGNQASAIGADSYAFGTGAKAIGAKSFAMGSSQLNDSTGKTVQTVASAEGAFALGFGSVASNIGAFAMGVLDTASGPGAMAMGYYTKSKGLFSTTLGAGTIVEPAGWQGLAAGIWTKAGDWAASAFGDRTYASGHTSFATGFTTVASGHLSSTFGDQTIAQSYGSMAIGRYNLAQGTSAVWNSGDPVFAIGNGTSSTARSNAFTVYKNGSADLGGHLNLNNYINLNRGTTGIAMYVSNDEALWYDGTTFSWGFGGTYNVFGDHVSVGTTGTSSAYELYVLGTAYATLYQGSDSRWKKDLEPLTDNLAELLKLQGFKYNWRTDDYPEMNFDSERQIGLIAQDVEKLFPELVKTDDKGYKAVSYEKLTVILLEGMKEQQRQIEAQNERIEKLEKLVGKKRINR